MVFPVDPTRFAAYASVTAVMVVAPGPANLFAIATGAQRGRRAVIAAVTGMNLANLIWWAAAAFGLGALALAFPLVFRGLTFLGAAYLAWLGITAVLARPDTAAQADALAIHRNRSALWDGFVVQITNPKALIFTTAVLPPFIDAGRPLVGQFAVFTATGMVMDIVAMTAYGFGGAALAARMTEPAFRRGFSVFSGLLLLIAAAIVVAGEL